MATANTSGGDSGADATACARDFVLDRLQEADSPMSPAELAAEYGCTNGHMRNTLRDLRDDGLVDRPSRGKYVAPDAEGYADMEPEGSDSPTPTTRDADTEIDTDFRGDGGPRSEDLDTEVPGDDEGSGDEWALADDHVDGQEQIDDQELEEVVDEQEVERSMSIPLPVSKTALFGGLAVVLLLVYWFRIRPAMQNGQGDVPEEETAQQGQQDGMAAPSGGGLMGGD